jgi:hypothetical protein
MENSCKFNANFHTANFQPICFSDWLFWSDTEIDKTALLDFAKDLQKTCKDFNAHFENVLKAHGIKE